MHQATTNPAPSEALEFLRAFRPAGRINLVAIDPETGATTGRNFTFPDEADAAARWIDERNGRVNLYFMVNEPKPGAPHKKLTKADVATIHAVFADCDPRKGEDLAAERRRLKQQARELAESPHNPTWMIDSGGGVQFVWILAEPLPNTPENRKAAEDQGRGLAAKLGGDAAQNIERVLRLPGTVNLPDARKQARGRVPAPAKHRKERGPRYSLADLAAFAPPIASSPKASADESIPLPELDWAAAELIPDLDELPGAVRAKLNAAMLQDRELRALWEGTKAPGQNDDSRSGFDWALMALLKRHQFNPTEAAQVLRAYPHGKGAELTERDFKRAWLRNPVQTAREEFGPLEPPSGADTAAASPHPIERLNASYAFVMVKGGHAILHETTDVEGNPTVELLKEASFHKKHAAETLQTGKTARAITELWMSDKRRRSYRGMCFLPGRKAPSGYYNLFRGFSFEPLSDCGPRGRAAVEAWKEHLLNNVARGNADHARWLTGWFAHLVQRPDEKPLVALALHGGKGVGKNTLVECVKALLGPHALLADDSRYLTGNFNSHMERLLLFILDEAIWTGDRRFEGRLKGLITGRDHLIERKGFEPYTARNLTRVVILSNSAHVVPASVDERRYAVFHVGDGRQQDRAYFKEMREGMEADNGAGYALLLHYLQSFDLSTVDVNAAPDTDALRKQKEYSRGPLEEYLDELLSNGCLPGSGAEARGGVIEISGMRALPADFEHWAARHKYNANETNRLKKQLRDFLEQALPTTFRVVAPKGETRKYVFGPIDKAAREWEAYCSGSTRRPGSS